MLLWTWQNKDISLADENLTLDNLKHSFYVNKHPNPKNREKHRIAYEIIFKILGTDQLVWCFTDYADAVSNFSIQEFEKYYQCVLWELDIPEKKIIWYCQVAWNALRSGEIKMYGEVWDIFDSSRPIFPKLTKKYDDDFHFYWSGKNASELSSLMFLKKPVLDLGFPNSVSSGCSGAIVIHPVEKNHIKRNPLKKGIGKWWTNSNSDFRRPPLNYDKELVKKIHCCQCPGR